MGREGGSIQARQGDFERVGKPTRGERSGGNLCVLCGFTSGRNTPDRDINYSLVTKKKGNTKKHMMRTEPKTQSLNKSEGVGQLKGRLLIQSRPVVRRGGGPAKK